MCRHITLRPHKICNSPLLWFRGALGLVFSIPLVRIVSQPDFGFRDFKIRFKIISSLSARNYPALVAGDHRADGAGAEVLGAGGGGGLWSGHSRQGNL